MTQQLDFLACVEGGSDAVEFGSLFGGLAALALATSGVDPEEYWSALGAKLSDIAAIETSRSDNGAIVDTSVRLTMEPNLSKLREMMRAGMEARHEPIDEGALDALLSQLIGRMPKDRLISGQVGVEETYSGWLACAPTAVP